MNLTANNPTIRFEAEGRELKTHHSHRSIPLAGVSLEAVREAVAMAEAAGRDKLFGRYFGNDHLSAAANKYLRENGLLEVKPDGREVTVYGLRHAFEDRMIEAGVDERVRSDLFGHSIARERYGSGGGDQVRHEAITRIAL